VKATAAELDFTRSTSSRANTVPLGVVALFFLVLVGEVVNQLGSEWSFNPQYSYAWSVPFLTLYLLWQRWTQSPPPAPPRTHFFAGALVVLCALLLLPVRFVAQTNADWRLLNWALALCAVTIALGLAFLTGGRPWLRHFAFPICFLLVAVPWPVRLEQIVIQNLMRAVSAINVSLLNIAGIPALQRGNVIELGNGLIGIEEACSGVRSFQATLMISLFLGEFYSFGAARRVLLLVAGALLAFVCNLIRTAILVFIGAKNGTNAIAGWHDPAGITILVVCLFALWFLSLRMQRPTDLPRPTVNRRPSTPFPFSVPLFLSLGAWILVAEIGVQVWSRAHPAPVANSRWNVQWPTAATEYNSMNIPVETRNLLRYHEGSAGTWRGEDGHPWLMYFFRWLPGRTAGLSVKIHRPDICLPATGMILTRDNGARRLRVNGVDLHVHGYRFEDRGVPLHVLYCYGDVRAGSDDHDSNAEQEDWTARGRLRAALNGRPEIGAVLELVVWGYRDDADADEAMQRELQQLVRAG
jgi:exosortase